MKVKAKRWINVDGAWHGSGEVFETESIAGFADAVEVVAEAKPVVEPEQPKKAEETIEKPVEKPAESVSRRRKGNR